MGKGRSTRPVYDVLQDQGSVLHFLFGRLSMIVTRATFKAQNCKNLICWNQSKIPKTLMIDSLFISLLPTNFGVLEKWFELRIQGRDLQKFRFCRVYMICGSQIKRYNCKVTPHKLLGDNEAILIAHTQQKDKAYLAGEGI